MSESTNEQTTETDAAQQDEQTHAKPTETVEFWKQKAREQEKRAKENAEAARRLQEFEDRDKSEAQKLAERADAAERRANEVEGRALRLEVAAENGLTPAQAKRLVGTSREELEADAAELLSTFKPPADDTSSAVAGSLDLGSRGTASTATNPAADFAKFISAQRKR